MYDIVIVGNGLIAESFLYGLFNRSSALKVCSISPANYPSSPLRTVELLGNREISMFSGGEGLGTGWHGLVPSMYIEAGASEALLDFWYGSLTHESVLKKQDDRIFVPYRVHRPKPLQHTRIERISSIVRSVRYHEKHVEVILQNGEVVFTKKLLLAAGPLNTYNILSRSEGVEGIYGLKSSMGDHITAYLGYIDQSFEPSDLVRHKAGFSYGVQVQESCVVFRRPALFDFKVPDVVSQHTRAWANQKSDILRKLVRLGSAGLVCEAVFNKLGLSLPAVGGTNLYAQIEVKGVFKKKTGGWVSDKEQIQLLVCKLNEVRSDILGLIGPSKQKLGVGIHYFGNVERFAESNICILDASEDSSLGNFHHTFKKCCDAFSKGIACG